MTFVAVSTERMPTSGRDSLDFVDGRSGHFSFDGTRLSAVCCSQACWRTGQLLALVRLPKDAHHPSCVPSSFDHLVRNGRLVSFRIKFLLFVEFVLVGVIFHFIQCSASNSLLFLARCQDWIDSHEETCQDAGCDIQLHNGECLVLKMSVVKEGTRSRICEGMPT